MPNCNEGNTADSADAQGHVKEKLGVGITMDNLNHVKNGVTSRLTKGIRSFT
jgi:hypothetical protein